MNKKFEFRIPQPRGLDAKPACKTLKQRDPMHQMPTDANQLAPTPEYPVRRGYRAAGGC